MLLAIDAGNTNVLFALFEDETLKGSWRIRTEATRTADEYAALLIQLFATDGFTFKQVSKVMMSSVVPDANRHLIELSQKNFKIDPVLITNRNVAPYLEIEIDKPEEAGTDRLMNALAVLTHYQSPAVVVDFGTSTNFDVVNKNGAFCGGVLAPGVNLSASALHAAAAKLPRVDIRKPEKVIGTNTVEAMRSGLYWGYIGMIEGVLMRIEKELGSKPLVIATGGLASIYADGTEMIDVVDETLTLKGLVRLHVLQNENAKAA